VTDRIIGLELNIGVMSGVVGLFKVTFYFASIFYYFLGL